MELITNRERRTENGKRRTENGGWSTGQGSRSRSGAMPWLGQQAADVRMRHGPGPGYQGRVQSVLPVDQER